MSVSVVIPAYNRCQELASAIDSICAQTLLPSEIIVVDNSSTDETGEMLAARAERMDLPLHHVVKEPEGPAAARNLGTRLAKSEFVLFQDSDVTLQPEWIARAAARLSGASGLAAVGGKVLYANDPAYLNSYGGALSRLGLAWDILEGSPARSVEREEPRLWINCSAVLMRRAAVLEVGGFDSRFFYAFEDSDLGWRLSVAGWDQLVLPDLEVLHQVGEEIGQSGPTIAHHVTKNRLASLIACTPWPGLALWLPVHLAYGLADALRPGNRGAKLSGLWWNLRNLGGTLARRHSLAAIRRRPRAEMGQLFAPRLFPETRLGGMRRRPNRVQSRAALGTSDDRD